MVRISGIDPGITGACALIEGEDGQTRSVAVIDACDIPTLGDASKREIDDLELIRWLKDHRPDHLYLENVWAMPSRPDDDGVRRGMGASSAFKFGMVFGQIKTCIRGCKVPFTLVSPLKWKTVYGLKGSDKENSRQKAISLFPQAHAMLNLKRHQNRAEALLIARWGLIHGDNVARREQPAA